MSQVIAAAGRITFSVLPGVEDQSDAAFDHSGAIVEGPGTLIVAAGESVDLGFSAGLRSKGKLSTKNSDNAYLSSQGADIIVASGYTLGSLLQDDQGQWDAEGHRRLFRSPARGGGSTTPHSCTARSSWTKRPSRPPSNRLPAWMTPSRACWRGTPSYDEVPAEVREALADLYLANIRAGVIDACLVTSDGGEAEAQSDLPAYGVADQIGALIDFKTGINPGDIRMTQSEIKSEQGGDIQVMLAGDFDVGISVFGDADNKSSTGINTVKGGDIAIYAGNDVNINESRVMSWVRRRYPHLGRLRQHQRRQGLQDPGQFQRTQEDL